MITYTEAQNILISRARSFGTEMVPLERAYGRVLTGPVRADRDYPPFDRATMDGYALRAEDLRQGIREFRIIETIFAGGAATKDLPAGSCYKIMTGAPVPAGADVVIRREDTEEGAALVRVRTGEVRDYLNIARQGEDLPAGEIVIERPCVGEPSIIGLMASLGQKELMAAKLPRVALVTTGDEVVPVEALPGPGQIRNSNRWLLQSFLKKWQIDVWSYQHVPDDKGLLGTALEKALSADVVICCGGVSAGDADYVPGALSAAGVDCLFHKLAIKPGKPVWCGITRSNALVFALPGNPFSCLVGAVLLIEPYLRACFGLPGEPPLSLPLGRWRKKHTLLDEFFPVRMQGTPARLIPVSLNGSGDIRMGMQANGLALHPAGTQDLEEGVPLIYFPL
jgi:molybdopterin molybdotransferase